jgi:hypothetical protein
MASEPVMQKGNYDEWLTIMKGATGLGATWLVLPDPRIIFGAALLLPGAAIGYSVEKGTWERVYVSLTTFDISHRISESLVERINKRYTSWTSPSGQIDIEINALGLEGEPRSQLCLIIQSDLVVNLDGLGCFVRKIRIEGENRDHGEPPPQCADISRFGDRNARLVKDTLREYAEITAFLTVQFISEVLEQ